MEPELERLREQQRESWNRFSPGWKKWDKLTMDFLQPMGEEMIRVLNLKEDDYVLDVACGTGEPGLTIAQNVKRGKVMLTDLSEEMLKIAAEHASLRGITNVETQVCDVCALPFRDYMFDAISCRFGFMFFPDMSLAAREMLRVLKPEGKLALAVWDIAEKNFWVTAITGVINKHMNLPPVEPRAPGMFRCAQDGLMIKLLCDAGFRNVAVGRVMGKLQVHTTENYWNMMNEIAAPVVAALNQADPELNAKMKAEVFQKVFERYPEGRVEIASSALIVYAEKERFE